MKRGKAKYYEQISRSQDLDALRLAEEAKLGRPLHRPVREGKERFQLEAPFAPTGDQPQAIKQLCEGVREGLRAQTLLGVTGSGKTFTMANIIQELQRPALILAPNKTLAGQLCSEFRAFFPHNRVEYFVSYYDYYQPEAYIPTTDTYIEKDSAINDEIDRMRHAATASLLERRDVIIVASVSCIYGLGDPDDYSELMLHLRPGDQRSRESIMKALVKIQYQRNDFDLKRGTFRARGDLLDIMPSSEDAQLIRLEFFDDEIEQIYEVNRLTGQILGKKAYVSLYPASHYSTTDLKLERAIRSIAEELEAQLKSLRAEGKVLEAYRLEQRTRYDLELLHETGFTKGIENYSRHMDGRAPGVAPYTLLDFFPDDFLLFIDESHVSVSQVGAMYNGDRARKESLVNFGFRLPSAYDNRPLRFPEFEARMGQTIFVSATPGSYERLRQERAVEQLIRPTGLTDPEIEIKPTHGQIEDLIAEVKARRERNERCLILTLKKKMAEDLAQYLKDASIKAAYLHSDLENDSRLQVLHDLRQGLYDVVVGINLLREGLDLPEVSLVAILDADQKGFLRAKTSLIQMIGRAARHENGHVIMYADEVSEAMYEAISETNRRRSIQQAYNKEHGITPSSVKKELRAVIQTYEDLEGEASGGGTPKAKRAKARTKLDRLSAKRQAPIKVAELKLSPNLEQQKDVEAFLKLGKEEAKRKLADLERRMKKAAKALEFEEAARLRDLYQSLKAQQGDE